MMQGQRVEKKLEGIIGLATISFFFHLYTEMHSRKQIFFPGGGKSKK